MGEQSKGYGASQTVLRLDQKDDNVLVKQSDARNELTCVTHYNSSFRVHPYRTHALRGFGFRRFCVFVMCKWGLVVKNMPFCERTIWMSPYLVFNIKSDSATASANESNL